MDSASGKSAAASEEAAHDHLPETGGSGAKKGHRRRRQRSRGGSSNQGQQQFEQEHQSEKPGSKKHGRHRGRQDNCASQTSGQDQHHTQFPKGYTTGGHQSPNRGNNGHTGRGSPQLRMPQSQNFIQGPSSPLGIPGQHSPVMFQRNAYGGSPHSPYSSPQPHSPGFNPFFQGGPGHSGQNQHQNQNPHYKGNRTPSGQGGKRGYNRGNTPNQRKKMFAPYMDLEEVSHGLKRNELIQGPLRINPRNYEDCYVPHPDGVSDVYISGLKDRNRALNGDIVVIQIYPKEEWKVLDDYVTANKEALEAIEKLTLQPGTPTTGATVGTPGSSGTPGQDQKKVFTPGQNKNLTPVQNQSGEQKPHAQNTPRKRFTNVKDYISQSEKQRVTKKLFADEDDDQNAQTKLDAELKNKVDALPVHMLLRTGKVVAILEKKHSRAGTGHIRLMADKNKNVALFASIDHRLPRMMIPMEDCPKDFYERPDDHSKTLFIARIVDWEEHSQYAKGRLARSLGEAGEIEPETEGILMSYDVDSAEFDDEVLACLPQNLPWKIPESEFAYRRDLRNECVFTIDPATARDLDDALHVISLGDGLYEIGVHIADVSFFIEDDTALDKIASERSTSVYLVQKVVPMLPRLLCEELCSLNPGKDRLTFSVIWKMTEDGEILEEWFGRSVIRSCVKMAYDHAQGFIEEPDREWTEAELPPITGGFSIATLKEKTLQLQKVAAHLRKKRFDSGALRMDQVKLSYTLDKDSGMPNGYYVYQQRESNKLIEEFMLLANMAVSHKIYKAYPSIALLRRHPPPQSRMMDDLVKTVRSLGLAIDVSSSKAIHESIQQAAGTTLEELARVQILTVLCSKPMQNAKYFCTGCYSDEAIFHHYALNVPLYTHFTSPIRRFPDVMVHRLLAASLGYRDPPTKEKEEIQVQASHCNDKKTNSKRVQELSSELFFAVFVKECGPLEERGMVMAVLDKAFDVLVLKLGVVKRVYCEKLPLREYKYSKAHGRQQLTLIWKASGEHPREVTQNITIFSSVDCVLAAAEEEPLKWTAITKHPNDGTP